MAIENILRFIDMAMTDKTLAAKVAALASENEYDFTAAELLELGERYPLSDIDVGNMTGSGGLPGIFAPLKIKYPLEK